MTAQLSREDLRLLALKKVESLKFAVSQSAFTNIRRELEGELQLAEFALAGMDSEPVISVIFKDGWPIPETVGIVAGSEKLPDGTHEFYAAPPAPVAVPDALEQFALFIAEEAIKSGEDQSGWRGKASNAAHEYALACRAAMQAEPVTAATVPDGVKEALSEAVAAIYFTDSSDYLSALFAVVKALSPETLELLLSNSKAAYEATRINAAPAAPEQEV